MSIAETPSSPLVVWRFSDGKRGHDNQSIGLCEALSEIRSVARHDVDVRAAPAHVADWFLRRFPPAAPLPDPHLLIGAGHATHLPMLVARHARGGRIIVLMKPTLPRRCFDLCVIPRHDNLASAAGVFITDGAINRIRPMAMPDTRAALVLVGGPSPHVDWDNEAVLEMVAGLVRAAPARDWQLVDSRRTPTALMQRLRDSFAGQASVRCVHWQDVDSDWLATQMPRCATVWVTSDSVSMLYEALSSGATVGVLPIPSRRGTRLSSGLEDLRGRGWLLDYRQWCAGNQAIPVRPTLSEARRCARFIVDELLAQP